MYLIIVWKTKGLDGVKKILMERESIYKKLKSNLLFYLFILLYAPHEDI